MKKVRSLAMPPENRSHSTPLRSLVFGWICFSLTVSLAIAFSGLEDAAPWPWFVQAMMGVVKSIEPWSLASPNPRHTAILFATLWAISPAVVVLVSKERDWYFPPPMWPSHRDIGSTLIAIALAIALVVFMIFGYGNDPAFWGDLDGRRSLRAFVLGSRLNAGAFGSLLVFFTAYTVTAAGVLLYRTFSRRDRCNDRSSF